jgi:transposase
LAKRLIGDKGHDADWLRHGLKAKGLRVGFPGRRGRLHPARHKRRLYKKHCRIETAFARLKDGRGIALRTTRCGDLFLSAIVLAATVLAATVIAWMP